MSAIFKHHPRRFAPVMAYLLVSLVVTWPLATRLQGWAPGMGDWGQNLWALWWTRLALLAPGHSLFFTNYLFYPEGVTLLFHPLDVSDGLLALPLYGLLGGDAAYNVMVLLSFVLAGYGAYLLTLHLTGRPGASFVAGLIFSLSPYHFLRIDLGHLNLSTIQWIPFFVLFLLRFIERGSKRTGALAVFFLVFNALNSWYYLIYCGLLALAAIFWPGAGRVEDRPGEGRRPGSTGAALVFSRLSRIGLVLGAAAILLSPLWWPMLQLLNSTTLVGAHDPLRHSVDLVSFWIPGPPSSWAGWFEEIWSPYAAQNREPGASAYLGYTVLGLAAVGVSRRRWRGRALWWLGLGFGFALLSLGPRLQVGGQVLDRPLLYALLSDLIPAFEIAGIPGRFVVITSLALAVLSGYGLAGLRRRPGGSRYAWGVWVAAALFVTLEYLAIPIRLSSTQTADFYRLMGADTETYAVVDFKWDANFLLHAQTVHGKPLIGGWLARLPAEQAAYLDEGNLDRVFSHALLGPAGPPADPVAARAAIQAALDRRHVRYIIVHNEAAGTLLEQVTGWQRIYQEDDLSVYARPGSK